MAEKTEGHQADIEVGIGSKEEKSIVCCGAVQSEYNVSSAVRRFRLDGFSFYARLHRQRFSNGQLPRGKSKMEHMN